MPKTHGREQEEDEKREEQGHKRNGCIVEPKGGSERTESGSESLK